MRLPQSPPSANNFHQIGQFNAANAAAKILDRNTTQLINRTQLNHPVDPSLHITSLPLPRNRRPGRNQFEDDLPEVQRPWDNSDRHTNSQSTYLPGPYAATEVSKQTLAGPALLSLQHIKVSRWESGSRQKRPLIFGGQFSPAQHAQHMLRCLGLMVEMIY